MKNKSQIYPHFTGNPFVDAGIAALCALNRKDEPQQISKDDLDGSADYISDLYLTWPKLGNLFTQNCTLLNPSNRTNREAKYKAELKELAENINPASASGSCAACGTREANVSRIFREKYPLTGSGDLVNYFSFFEPGFPICAACAFAVQFTPLYLISSAEPKKVESKEFLCSKCQRKATYQVEGVSYCSQHLPFTKNSLFLAHSHNTKVMLSLAKDALTYIRGQVASGASPHYYSKFHISDVNECTVKLARHLISISEAYGEPVSVRLYSFVNSGQINLLDFTDLPTQVFAFLENANLRGLNKNLNELFGNSSREIYRRLVNEESIKYFFVRRKEREIIGGWELFELYLEEVERMEKERLEVIKRVGQRLYQYLEATNFKKLKDIEMAGKYGEFRMELTRIQKEKLVWEIDDEPFLFHHDKEGAILWRETQSILLAFIYAQMHKAGINPKEV